MMGQPGNELDRTTVIYGEVNNAEIEFFQTLYTPTEDRFQQIIYICFNKPARVIKERLEKPLTEKLFFIDMLNKGEGADGSENILFMDKPTDYNNLLEVLNSLLKEEKCMVVLDNLHSVFLFNNQDRVLLFLKNLFNTVSEKRGYLLTYLIRGSLEKEVEKSVLSFADRIIELPVEKSMWEEWNRMTLCDLFSLKNPLLYIIVTTQLVTITVLILLLFFMLR